MRWHSPSDTVKKIIRIPVVVVAVIVTGVTAPFIAVAALGIYTHDAIDRLTTPHPAWHRWFAWRPVRVDYGHRSSPNARCWVWLETVERRGSERDNWPTRYRRCEDHDSYESQHRRRSVALVTKAGLNDLKHQYDATIKAITIVEGMGYPSHVSGHYVNELREVILKKVKSGLVGIGAGTWQAGSENLSHEERAKAQLAMMWAADNSRSCNVEWGDPVIYRRFNLAAMKNTLVINWKMLPAKARDLCRKGWSKIRRPFLGRNPYL